MKTAAAVLQEMMVKLNEVPIYEGVSRMGPHYQCIYEIRCTALNMEVTATGSSKKEAKQIAARQMLENLAKHGHRVPPFAPGPQAHPTTDSANRNYVVLLKELVYEYRLPAVEYKLVGDTGPRHLREFTMTARVGSQVFEATASTKKAARRLAAQKLYKYFRDHLRATRDFAEDEAVIRAHRKVMGTYTETRQELESKPDLTQKVADYHLGLIANIDEAKLELVKVAIGAADSNSNQHTLEKVAELLRLSLHYSKMPSTQGELVLLNLRNTTPELAFVADSQDKVAAEAIDYIKIMLRTVSTKANN